MRVCLILIALFLVHLVPSNAHAATCTASIGDLAFGSVDTLSSTGASASTDIVLDCDDLTSGSSVAACIYIGSRSSSARVMTSGTSELEYGLYADAGESIAWGTGSSSTSGSGQSLVLAATSDGTASGSKTIYGAVPGNQTSAAVGTYTAQIGDVSIYYAEADSLDCDSPSGYLSTYGSFSLSATVSANCNISVSDLNFGSVGMISENIEATAALDVECTPGASYSIALGNGNNYSGSTRRMRSSAGNYVEYGLYQSANGTMPWGSTTTSDTLDGVATGSDSQTIFGLVPPQSATAGAYTDTVIVTITY